jgi:hypothetical protein
MGLVKKYALYHAGFPSIRAQAPSSVTLSLSVCECVLVLPRPACSLVLSTSESDG